MIEKWLHFVYFQNCNCTTSVMQALITEKDEINMIIVPLNDSLISRIKKWHDADCEVIRIFKPFSFEIIKEESSIAKMEKKIKHPKEVELFEKEKNMMFV